jgi:hypothetical protein
MRAGPGGVEEGEEAMPAVALQPAPIAHVVGPDQPLRGMSGSLRRVAYRIPEHRVRRWLVLLLADRVELLETRLADPARRGPIVALASLSVGVLVGSALIRRWR